jgi:hypothetical protein
MINFDFKGITIAAVASNAACNYKDARNYERTRFDKTVNIVVSFWGFEIENGDLTKLAHVKSVFQYFLHWYWKRVSAKVGGKIELDNNLHKTNSHGGHETLYFVARQKNNKHYLQIGYKKNGETIREIYLDGQEIILMDIAVGKAINLMIPSSESRVSESFAYR